MKRKADQVSASTKRAEDQGKRRRRDELAVILRTLFTEKLSKSGKVWNLGYPILDDEKSLSKADIDGSKYDVKLGARQAVEISLG